MGFVLTRVKISVFIVTVENALLVIDHDQPAFVADEGVFRDVLESISSCMVSVLQTLVVLVLKRVVIVFPVEKILHFKTNFNKYNLDLTIFLLVTI